MKGAQIITAILVLLCVGLLAMQAEEPLLWTAEGTENPAEADLSAAEKINAKSAGSLLPLMQDLLGQGSTVVLSVQVKDFESAQKDLKKYSEMTRSMDSLVVKLDLTGTDIDEFRKKSRENMESLTTLVNGTERLEEVRVEYQDEKDPGKVYSLVYEGEALKKELQGAATTYEKDANRTVAIGEKYEADTTAYKESIGAFRAIVGEETKADSRGPGIALPPPALTLAVEPMEARFGDLVTLRGTAPAGKTVEAFVDSRPVGTATSQAGNYAIDYRIEKGRASPHLAYVQAGKAVSGLVEFTVLTSPADLTLAANKSVVSGTLTANGRGVEGAEIILLVDDGALTAALTTGKGGDYEEEIGLPEGRHTLQAVFSGEGFPLDPAESPEIVVEVGGFPAGAVAIILLLGGAGGYVYLRHRRKKEEALPVLAARLEASIPLEEKEEETPLTIAGLTLEEAAGALWQGLADAAERHYGVRGARTRTPREIAAALAGTPAREPAAAFAKLYEAVRYAGFPYGEEEVERLEAIYHAVREPEG
ncbi:MAG: DUF4129 domain-containing protein [Methanofollis sp.]|uniref:DUF4129 domain-containing protein n=1 Tax=Methanofollis sp. TaxID=2052835 RepID=UPI00260A6A21|nr:DUF4129 domain-containing protein [Methanofollis sp.]MDD4256073.1 DUF4129 domain-containing protein [Methanofollis sp.]